MNLQAIWASRYDGVSYHCANREEAEALTAFHRSLGLPAVTVLLIKEVA